MKRRTATAPTRRLGKNSEDGILSMDKVVETPIPRFSTGYAKLDAVFGCQQTFDSNYNVIAEEWGIARGMIYLFGGGKGTGKTRFITSLGIDLVEDHGLKVGYVQGEMSLGQYKSIVMSSYKGKRREPDNIKNFIAGGKNLRFLDEQLKFIRDEQPDLWVVDSFNMLPESATKDGIEEMIFKFKEVIGQHTSVWMICHLNERGKVKGNNHIQYMSDSEFILNRTETKGEFTLCAPEKNRGGTTGVVATLRHAHGTVEVVPDVDYSQSLPW